MLLKTPLWRQTPPAIFPVCLGFMGLSLGWRSAASVLPIAPEIGDLMLGMSTAFFVYFLVFYLIKLAARPAVLFEDMRNAPARAGVASLAMSMMLLAAALLPLNISVPQVWWTGVILQILATIIVLYALWKEPKGKCRFSPFQYLTFVGPVVGPMAGIPLGYEVESLILTYAALGAYVIVTIGCAERLRRTRPPLHLRPSIAIFLAPTSLFALSFAMLHFETAFLVFYWISTLMAVVLLLLAKWMAKGGWTPIWAAFTFPIATFTHMQILAMGEGYGLVATIGTLVGLAVGTPLILYVVYRSAMAWVTGDLGRNSGAATA